jgi:glycosyltransferase involved in cell wall biosynthesis
LKLRVAYDVTSCIVGDTGVARHTPPVARAQPAHGVTVQPFALGRASQPVPAGTRWIRVPLRLLHAAWSTAHVPRLDWLVPAADIVHTDLLVPPTKRPVVVTVYDLDAVQHPDLHPARSVQNQQAMLDSLVRAAAVVAISQTTADALHGRGVPGDRIVVAPSGLTPLPDAAPARLAGAERYVLHVGSLHRRKGLDVLLTAWAAAAVPHDVVLVLAGPNGNAADALRAQAAELGLGDRVRWEGRVDDARLASLYAGASAACFPSRSEGFGLPVLEAMAAGIPLVASDIPAFREVAAGAGILVPVDDAGALSDAIAGVLAGDVSVGQRVRVGRERAALFTWDACASRTVQAYERAAA